MPKTIINPPDVWDPKPYLFSHAVKKAGKSFVFVAGQNGIDVRGQIVGGFEPQTRQAFENLRRILKAAGGTFDDVTMLHVYLLNIDNLTKYMAVQREFIPANFPAQTAVEVPRLALPGLLIEIEAMAVV
jgi:enamine deaminase RidA (YjgF/YER057c/UK114 family)